MASKCHNVDDQGRRAIITMNKKKYFELEKHLKDFTRDQGMKEEAFQAMCDMICRVLAFNPELKAYKTEEMRRKKDEYKKKLAEKNMTTWDAYGRAYYEANKEECIKRSTLCRAAKRTTQVS